MVNNKNALEKRRKDDEATAIVFQEYIDTFQNDYPSRKVFIKSGTYNGGKSEEVDVDKGTIYNTAPLAKLTASNVKRKAIECAKLVKDNSYENSKNASRPKSNLEILKEELRLRHLERDRLKVILAENYRNPDTVDNTTNLFLTNLNPHLNEQDLMRIFGVYGPLAGVKIMWPRNEYRTRNTNIGFVAFMSRKDSERAFANLGSRTDMRISWGKPFDIPSHPVYIPPALVKMMLPPPYTGLPFNAQPLNKNYIYPKNQNEMNYLLYHSTVKVTIPLDKKILSIIHRVIEFTIREGPEFEAILLQNEINNPNYQFLFDTKSPDHVYYRWKLFSLLNGESTDSWSTKPFRMFIYGSMWIPPIIPDYTQGMNDPEPILVKKEPGLLSDNQQYRLIEIIQNLTMERASIKEAMAFVVKHANANKDVINIIVESFNNIKTQPEKKIARLYLISDVLHNIRETSAYNTMKQKFESKLEQIFTNLGLTLRNLTLSSMKTGYKSRILKVLRAWNIWKLFPHEHLEKLEALIVDENFEDHGINEGPLDGKLLLTRALNYNPSYLVTLPTDKNTSSCLERKTNDKNEEFCSKKEFVQQNNKNIDDYIFSNFTKSKWETLDPAQLESQAMSTKKLHQLQFQLSRKEKHSKPEPELDYKTLRKIEVKVLEFQDQFERKRKWPKNGRTIEEEVNEYRKKCIRKAQDKYKGGVGRIDTSSINSDDSFYSAEDSCKRRKIKKTHHKSKRPY